MTDLTVDGQFDIAVAESLVLEVRTFSRMDQRDTWSGPTVHQTCQRATDALNPREKKK